MTDTQKTPAPAMLELFEPGRRVRIIDNDETTYEITAVHPETGFLVVDDNTHVPMAMCQPIDAKLLGLTSKRADGAILAFRHLIDVCSTGLTIDERAMLCDMVAELQDDLPAHAGALANTSRSDPPPTVPMIPLTADLAAALECFMADGHPATDFGIDGDERAYVFTPKDVAAVRRALSDANVTFSFAIHRVDA